MTEHKCLTQPNSFPDLLVSHRIRYWRGPLPFRFDTLGAVPDINKYAAHTTGVADVYLVAWRRFDHLPESLGQRRAWLYGTARRTLLNATRGHGRQHALEVRLVDFTSIEAGVSTEADLTALRVDISAAWPTLSGVDQEALCLSVLDGLDAPSAATVLGITPVAYRLRLSRARRALRSRIDPSRSSSPLDRTRR